MFFMNRALEEQTEPVLRALLNLHKTKEGRQKIIDILESRKPRADVQKRPLKRN
jgi:hypothetical protein